MINFQNEILKIFSCVIFAWIIQQPTDAQKSPVITGRSSLQSIVYSGDLPPLWQTSLFEGRWNNLGENYMLATISSSMNWQVTNRVSLKAMAEMNHSSGFRETYLHTGWFGIKWNCWSLQAGRHLFDPIFSDFNSGSGSYLFGSDYRPVMRVTLGIPAFTKVPFAGDRIEVRGSITQGWLTDQPSSGDVLLHEKYAYLRWDGGDWKPYFGINHSTLFGGRKNNGGDNIPVDYWATFFGKGSEKIGGGEASNAAGAHMGLYDLGTYFNTELGIFHLYYQIPFSDGSGMHFWKGNTDHVLGLDWKPDNSRWLRNLTLEWIQTTYQSGNGMPDPGAIMDGQYVHYNNLSDSDMYKLSGIEKSNWFDDEIINVLIKQVNDGNDFGGRDGYMNNGSYPDGWSRNNQIMGSPFLMTKKQLLEIRPGMEFNHYVGIKNDRFQAIHAGAEGSMTSYITWRSKITYTRNFGTYYEQYPGRYTWNEDEDYWFTGGRNQWYTLFEIDWTLPAVKGLNALAGIAFDCGEIYHSSGIKAGFIYKLK